ncbi:MAG: hypothetical protein EAY81_11715 [Bacteroidetes bacterium]|nr:MAG: hypothetical protein EAY81_11715 [Bacteroidota bacterium]
MVNKQENQMLQSFESVEEQAEYHCQQLAKLTPVQHLTSGVANIKRIFAEQLCENNSIDDTLQFD